MSDDLDVAKLILGPLLRRVTADQAVIWLRTDAPATVTVTAAGATAAVSTFAVNGVHVALPVLSGLPGGASEYRVEVDGEQVWPLAENPPSVITISPGGDATIVFGSCREAEAHPDPDALVAYARRAMRGQVLLPDLLALIGDQVYADDVWEFDDYVTLYQQAWSEPSVRWLLSTVSTVMIFDDHEIHDDWNSSAAWLADMRARPGWQEHLRAGLLAYQLFQHLGNLTPAELDAADPLRLPDDWSFTVDIGRTRLIMLDCRGSRVLDERRMFPQAHWDRLAAAAEVDCDHLVLACSLPWLLAPAIHHAEAAMEVLSHRWGGAMEKLRRKYDLEHWAAVGHSFEELTSLIQGTARPATVSVVGGDVHHSYVAEARLPDRESVYQITCSPLNNSLDAKMRLMLRLGWSRMLSAPAALLARSMGVPRPRIRWRALSKPYFGNAIATLTNRGRSATLVLEGTGSSGELVPVAAHVLHNGYS